MAKQKTKNEKPVVAYKGFDQQLQCRGFEYELGHTFIHNGKVQACDSGFHACEYPLDVFSYYPPVNSRYAIVECSGETDHRGDDSKIACAQISIKAEVKIPDMVGRAIDWIMERIDHTKSENGDRSAASNTGDYSAASNTGDYSAASNTGNRSAASNTGDYSAASNTGDYSAASNTGFQSAASNTGNRSAASNTGDRSAASNTGDYSAASNTGDYSAASNTGDYSAASVSGQYSVAMATGRESRAKASTDSAIVLVYRGEDGEILHIRCGIAGKDIKPDVWYTLDADGEFKEVEDEG